MFLAACGQSPTPPNNALQTLIVPTVVIPTEETKETKTEENKETKPEEKESEKKEETTEKTDKKGKKEKTDKKVKLLMRRCKVKYQALAIL